MKSLHCSTALSANNLITKCYAVSRWCIMWLRYITCLLSTVVLTRFVFTTFLRKILERPQKYKRVSNHKISVVGEILTNISSEDSNNIIRCFAYYTAFKLREFNQIWIRSMRNPWSSKNLIHKYLMRKST